MAGWVVPTLPWFGFALIYSGGPNKPSLGALYLKRGPLYFIIHINDLPLELHSDVTSTMFAGDTTILVRGPSVRGPSSSRLSLLRRIKPYLNSDSALRFYNSCVNNYFIYCSAAWGNCSHHLLLRLLRLQKRAGRILLDADLSQASISLFLKLNWIPVFDLIKYRKLFLLFIVLLNPNAPKCLRNRFQFLCDSRGPLGRFTREKMRDFWAKPTCFDPLWSFVFKWHPMKSLFSSFLFSLPRASPFSWEVLRALYYGSIGEHLSVRQSCAYLIDFGE